MKAPKLFLFLLSGLIISPLAQAGTEVDRLLAEYEKIETVTCKIRRTKKGAAGKMTFLSRVYFTNQNKLHAEKLTPVKQRTIVDGTTLYQYTEGSNNKGFSRPVSELSEQMKISLQLVPGTAMEHLLRLKGKEETSLPATKESAKRVGIQADTNYVVLLFDTNDHLTGVDFFKTGVMENKYADYNYSNFSEVTPGVWVPFLHEAMINYPEAQFTETVKIDRYVTNKPIAESLFIPSNFFDKNIDFVDDFAKIFPE
ncbi:MAG: hypothetical protein V3V05_05545 [Pontiella sp.]